MRIAFRTDASLQIGTGHVMRCLTLAKALAAQGMACEFICREHPGNLIEFIRSQGFIAHSLPLQPETGTTDSGSGPLHRHWLGATQQQDAAACRPLLAEHRPDWLITDHYALDRCWEESLAPHYRKLMVIDDLADRPHTCDLLLDQTFGRDPADYRPLVPATCRLLCGSQYALLRPEFASLRRYSLLRRAQPALQELLITMGGVDRNNATGQVLKMLRSTPLHADCRITVVMGATAPWLDEVRTQMQTLPWATRTLVGVNDMAQLMADSDLAIGAAGATSWERCCLGLPTIMVVLADNQLKVAQGLEHAGAAVLVTFGTDSERQFASLLSALLADPNILHAMSRSAASIADGTGTNSVLALLKAQDD